MFWAIVTSVPRWLVGRGARVATTTIAECERHESNSSSIDQHVALRAPNMPMHHVVVYGRSGLYDAALDGAVRTLGPTSGQRKFFNPRCAGFIGETGRPVGSRE